MKKYLLTLNYLFVLMLAVTSVAYGQITTSSMTGTVRDSKETIIGGTVKATHLPTGTVYATTTNADGRFSLLNMRPGGPYTVQVTYVGYQAKTSSNIFLTLGEPFVLNVTLSQASTELSEIVVTAGGNSILSSDRSGSVTNIGTAQINEIPTINRGINSLTRVTPQAQGNSIGGGNYRQNNITVDGANFNNSFGIGTNLPGGQANPIVLDALGEISVNVTPVDVRQSGFIGGAVNATTRSGTNEFSGSAYTYFRNQNNVGTRVGGYDELIPNPNDVKIYGFRLGGPIIKNKLFFFASVESDKQSRPGQNRLASVDPSDFGVNPRANRPTRAELDEISQYLRDTYGYETGGYDGYGFESERLNLLGRIDWNINKDHKFTLRYSQLESKSPSFLSNSTNPFIGSPYPVNGSRTDNNALAFENSNYFTDNNYYSLVAELNSTFGGGRFSNTLRASYSNQNEPRTSNSSVFPFVDILKDGRPFTSFGYEPFSFGNLRDVESYNVIDYIQTTIGRHNLLGGIEFETSTTQNGFQRFATSYYIFNSFDDFRNDADPIGYAKTFSLTPGYAQAFPTFKDSKYSLYAQDDFTVNDRLRLSFGIRGDLYTYKQDLLSHPLLTPLTFANGEKLDTGVLPSSALLVSPRFGFNYDVKGDRTLQFRGAVGVYSGGIPKVWIVSQAGDSGLLQFSEVLQNNFNPIPNRKFNPDINTYLPATQPTPGQALPNAISLLTPNVKAPQSFKTSLAMDVKLPFGLIGTLEGIYNYDINQVFFRNPNLDPTKAAPLNAAGYPDNRIIYPNSNTDKYINKLSGAGLPSTTEAGALNTYVLDNASGGYNYSITARIEKQFSKGFSSFIAYTRQEGKNFFDGGGDQPSGSWLNNPTINGSNSKELGYNGFVPDRVVAGITYKKEYLRNLGTTISLIYEGSSQGRVSYTYSLDMNRDGANADLIYVPRNPSEITFTPFTAGTGPNAITYTAQQQSDLFFRLIEQDKYLNSRRGKYAERNGGLLPWVNNVDLNLFQDLFVNVGKKKNTLQFNLTVENFGNLINRNWGVRYFLVRNQLLVPTNLAALDANGATRPTYRLQFDGNAPSPTILRDNVGFASTYSMQFGLRYIFN
ncbi:TonB-dependent receptor [Pedobacter glucosidilyticus]|uniref:TonB-dependent receptor n=1 Tax=Pedobacter glucosidilyticus TaxID=1122941 RepID=UPI00047DB020|nr:carboxypeptidase regulatory-like domain-containing protein [Pedobacter glucosidilyticus]